MKKADHIKNKKSLKYITIMLALVTVVIWIGILWIKHSFFTGITYSDLLDDILGNLLGILPPIVLFNFAYEYFTKLYVSDEISENITEAIMGNKEVIQLFDDTAKKKFIGATLSTIVDEEEYDMVYGVLAPYLTSSYNMKRYFRYSIVLREYSHDAFFSPTDYIKVQERLSFKKCFVGDNRLSPNFRLGFFTDNGQLDKELRCHEYLFREAIHMQKKDIGKLAALDNQQKSDFITREMGLVVLIENQKTEIKDFTIDNSGINITFESSHDQDARSLTVDIIFAIPQLKSKSNFLVSISEPTYSPLIQFSYPEDKFDVTLFPFLNDGDETLVQCAMPSLGTCDIYMREKWIYPMSGVVFTINEKHL